MNVLGGVLQEERERMENNILRYKKMLLSLPRGTIFVRKMGNSFFAYRKYKQDGKVLSKYLGNIELPEVKHEIELSKDYKRIKKNIIIAKNELATLNKVIRFYGK